MVFFSCGKLGWVSIFAFFFLFIWKKIGGLDALFQSLQVAVHVFETRNAPCEGYQALLKL